MNLDVKVIVPHIPHQLAITHPAIESACPQEEVLLSIADIPIAELERIGASWTNELIEKARELKAKGLSNQT